MEFQNFEGSDGLKPYSIWSPEYKLPFLERRLASECMPPRGLPQGLFKNNLRAYIWNLTLKEVPEWEIW